MNMNDVWLEPKQILQNKCIGRHHWESFGEMCEWCQTKCPVRCRYEKRYPFEDAYFVPGLGKLTKDQFEKLRTCTIAFTMIPDYDDSGREVHWYFTAYGHDGAVFVKSFKDGVLNGDEYAECKKGILNMIAIGDDNDYNSDPKKNVMEILNRLKS